MNKLITNPIEITKAIKAVKCYRNMYLTSKDIDIRYKAFKLYNKYSAKLHVLMRDL